MSSMTRISWYFEAHSVQINLGLEDDVELINSWVYIHVSRLVHRRVSFSECLISESIRIRKCRGVFI